MHRFFRQTRRYPDRQAYTDRLAAVALFYLVAVGANERVIYFVDPLLGLILNCLLLVVGVLYVAATWDREPYKCLLSLSLVPLIRLISITLPLQQLSVIYWYVLLSLPVLITAVLMIERLELSPYETGLNRRRLPQQVVIGAAGVLIGLVQYHFLKPDALADGYTLHELALPALILLFCAGFVDELVFRGIIQPAMIRMLGWIGVLYTAVLYALLSLGEQSPPYTLFVFVFSLLFGVVAARTHSIIGISLAHGIANIVLFLVLPFSPGGFPPW